VGVDRGALLRRYVYDFIGLLAPHLSRRVIDRARSAGSQAEVDAQFDVSELPRR
jgi:LysR family cys regulon transcriptional activator